MAWTKIPAAAASIACAACIAAAAAVPGAEMQAAHLAKTVNGDVQFVALEDVLTDVLNATLQLDSLNGIAPLLNFAVGGGGDPLNAFVPADDWPGYAALSALWNYQNFLLGGGDLGYEGLGGIAAFDALPLWLSGDLSYPLTYVAAVNGIPAYAEYLETFNLEAFRQTDTHLGLDALSALPLYEDLFSEDETVRDDALSNLASVSAIPAYKTLVSSGATEAERDDALRSLDSVSAVPEYKTLLSRDATVAERADALRSLDAFSAIPVYLNLPTVPEEETADLTTLAKTEVTPSSEKGSAEQAKLPKLIAEVSSVTAPPAEASDAGTPAVAPAAPAAPEAPTTPAASDKSSGSSGRQSNGSYSGVFKPNNPVVLFGTGKGGGADSGIRGWGKVANGIRGALGLPKDNSGSSDSGSSSGGE